MTWIDGLLASWSTLISGLGNTLLLAVVVIFSATLLGLAIGLITAYRVPVISSILKLYVSLFRSIPLPLLLLAILFGSIQFGVYGLGVFMTATIAMTIYEAAYLAEIFRSGIESVPVGQQEASRVLGLSKYSTNRFVILPQALKLLTPSLVGHYIWLIKDTGLALLIGYNELLRSGQAIIDRVGFPLEIYAVVGAIYFAICYPLSVFQRKLQRKQNHDN